MKKHLFPCRLAMLFCVIGITITAFDASALTQTKNGIKWTYGVYDGWAYVVSIPKNTSGAITVPSKLGGFPVRSFFAGKYVGAFEKCTKLTSITIPSSVFIIPNWTFANCSHLKEIVFLGAKPETESFAFADLPASCKIYVPRRLFPKDVYVTQYSGATWQNLCGKYYKSDLDYIDSYDIDVGQGKPMLLYNIDYEECYDNSFYTGHFWYSDGWSELTIPGTWHGLTIRYIKTATITFKANGGKGTMSPQTLTWNKSARLSANNFTRNGYVFIGWATSKKGTVVYKNKQSVKNIASTGCVTKLYAVWAKSTYKVVFYANGGKGKMTAQKMTYGKAAKLKANKFKRAGYTFKGWAKSKALADAGKVAYKNKRAVKNLDKNGKTVKLYAVWAKK